MLVAHQGGWDEALIVLAPMLVFFGLLYVANRRAKLLDGEPDERTDERADERAVEER